MEEILLIKDQSSWSFLLFIDYVFGGDGDGIFSFHTDSRSGVSRVEPEVGGAG